jgi:FAD/FMN-containing dehydrogenase
MTDVADHAATALDDDVALFRRIAGADAVSADPRLLALFSQDVWAAGDHRAELVVSPRNTKALAETAAAASARGWTLAVRGGGMSYTAGYVPVAPRTLLVDLSRMDRVLAVNASDMTVTVEAGCTWKTLYERLAADGLRTPFWGPLSGISSTVGGGVAQLNAVFGAGRHGTSSESVIGLTVVLPDGAVLRTGAKGRGEAPFYRHYGPDLTGLFCGDCGALGIKTEITLRLVRPPAYVQGLSFGFPTRSAVAHAAAELARAEVAAEAFGFDPGLAAVRLKRASLLSDVRTLGRVAKGRGSLLRGLFDAARVARAGRDFLGPDAWSYHLVCEGRSREALQSDLDAARRICTAAGGREVENSIPTVMRAQPFTPLNNVLGPGGERWVPVHGLVSLSDANPCLEALERLFDELRPTLDRHAVQVGFMLTTLSTNAFLIEPVFFWPEARRALHEATVEPRMLAKLPTHPENPDATAAVADARARAIDVFQRFGAAHFQIGRTYPYRASRDAASRRLLDALKAALDPERRLNPGVLER